MDENIDKQVDEYVNTHSAFEMNRTEYKWFVRQLLDNDEITPSAYEALLELAINYKE